MSVALLYSGGLDSMLLRLRFPDALPVHVEYGQLYAEAERQAMAAQAHAAAFGAPVLTVTAALPAAGPDGHVPHRNLALAVLAAAHTGASTILLGGVKGESGLDKSASFMRAAGEALSRSEGSTVALRAPLRARTKSQHLARLVKDRGLSEAQALLNLTTSCYAARWDSEGEIGCGRCLACFRRWVAVTNAGLVSRFEAWPPTQVDRNPRQVRYLLRAPVREWPGIVHNHLDAERAMRR